MRKNLKYYVIVLALLLIGVLLLHKLLNNYNNFEQQKIDAQLNKAHTDAMINVNAGIEVYASLVSSLKSFTKNTKTFPAEKQLQSFINDFLNEIKFNDSIVVNYIDTEHVFKYVITPKKIDPPGLKGVSVKTFRPQKRIHELDSLMLTDDIKLFTPINLREGWAGFPFNFSARDNENDVIGYVTPILNVKYLLDYFYENNNQDTYVHKFLIDDTYDLTREVFYNGSEIFNKARDPEYYKNYQVVENDFIYTSIQPFGLKLKIGSAYKNKPIVNQNIHNIAYGWYALLSFLILITLQQYLKNKTLNSSLKVANVELENNLSKIQTLIKEIHHRVKNNMLMISGILSMQMDEYEDDNVKSALLQSQNRIHSMSLVHEKLYGTASLKDVKINEYVTQLLEYVEDTVRKKSMIVNKHIKVDEKLVFDGDTATNLGLIINELVTNSYKYAFVEGIQNTMNITISKENNSYKLEYKDNGQGLPETFNIETAQSLGMQLISILTEQLSGTLQYTNTPESTFVIYFNPLENAFKSTI